MALRWEPPEARRSPLPPGLSSLEADACAEADVAAGERGVVLEQAGAPARIDIEQRTDANDPYTKGLPADVQQKLAKRYGDIFALFLKYEDTIERVTFWGVTDGDSWLNNWPVPRRTNHPLLFDRAGQPKPAFEAVIQAASGAKR